MAGFFLTRARSFNDRAIRRDFAKSTGCDCQTRWRYFIFDFILMVLPATMKVPYPR
jgi:hypothetical protein